MYKMTKVGNNFGHLNNNSFPLSSQHRPIFHQIFLLIIILIHTSYYIRLDYICLLIMLPSLFYVPHMPFNLPS